MPQRLNKARYDVFTATRTRRNTNGLVAMPVAGPYPTPAVMVALHGGLEDDVIWYSAVKLGEPPQIPQPYTPNPNRVYLDGWQSAAWPVPEVSGAVNYVTVGMYRFQILAPEGLESDFYLGTIPFGGLSAADMVIPGNYQYQGINATPIRQVSGKAIPNLSTLVNTVRLLQSGGGN